MDDGNRSRKILLHRATPEEIDQHLTSQLSNVYPDIESFSSVRQLMTFFKLLNFEIWEERINRGLLVKLPYEEERRVLENFKIRN